MWIISINFRALKIAHKDLRKKDGDMKTMEDQLIIEKGNFIKLTKKLKEDHEVKCQNLINLLIIETWKRTYRFTS